VVGLTDFDVWPKELAQRYVDDDRSVMATRKQKDVEEPIFTEGASRWFETFKTPVLDKLGKVLGTTGFSRDITERQRLDAELRAQREQLRALAAHVESVREEERVRIAREIHDELGQALTCMSMDLAFLDKQLPGGNADAAARVSALAVLVKETVKTVRRISAELRPSILDDLGLGAAVEWLARDFETRTGIGCAVSVPSTVNISAERGTVVFRMCQEALTNVARHAGATHVSIDLIEAGDKPDHRGARQRPRHHRRGSPPARLARPARHARTRGPSRRRGRGQGQQGSGNHRHGPGAASATASICAGVPGPNQGPSFAPRTSVTSPSWWTPGQPAILACSPILAAVH
jgi:PAS domain-containing protein